MFISLFRMSKTWHLTLSSFDGSAGAGHQAQREAVKSWPPTWPVQPATLTPKHVP